MDRAWQLFYRLAFRLMRLYWWIVRPKTRGALVAIWSGQRILLVKNSYVSFWSLPGGHVKRGEDPKDAALRELAEEVGIASSPERLSLALEREHVWDHKLDRVSIFRLALDAEPEIRIDRREVVEARFFSPAEALAKELFPPLREHIEAAGEPE